MPIPFDDPTEPNPHGTIAWLRFVEETDGKGIQAALFQTSTQGEPLSFCFTRMDARDPSLGQSVNGRLTALPALAKSLFRATSISPALILGVADEIPARALTDHLRVGLPACLTGTADWANGHRPNLDWVTKQPHEAPDARRILDEVMGKDNPFEPFDRAAKCLAEAFVDRRIHSLTAVPGLNTLVTLSPPPERWEHPATPLSTIREAVRTTKPLSRSRGERRLT